MTKIISHTNPKMVNGARRQQAYRIYQPLHILAMTVASSALMSFFIGRAARLYIVLPVLLSDDTPCSNNLSLGVILSDDTCKSSLSGVWRLNEEAVGDTSHRQDEDKEGLPVGSHLLLDFQGLDSDFLRSEDKMKQALLDIIQQHGDFDLQYIYSKRTDLGNVVIGGLSDARQHAWLYSMPRQGVLMLDLFAGDEADDIIELVSTAENVFARKTGRSSGSSRWVLKSRVAALHDALDDATEHAMTDLHWFPIGSMIDYKQQVRSNNLYSLSRKAQETEALFASFFILRLRRFRVHSST
jgi:hypothetical protein